MLRKALDVQKIDWTSAHMSDAAADLGHVLSYSAVRLAATPHHFQIDSEFLGLEGER